MSVSIGGKRSEQIGGFLLYLQKGHNIYKNLEWNMRNADEGIINQYMYGSSAVFAN